MTDTAPASQAPTLSAIDSDGNGPTVVFPTARGIGGRVFWMSIDQALSSASNIGTGIVAARALNRQDFGAFGLAYTIYILVIGTTRALVTEPMISQYSRVARKLLRPMLRAASGSATVIGIVTGILVAIVGAILGGPAGRAFVAMAIFLPGLLLQDAWRYCFVVERRPRATVSNDAVWCLLQIGGLAAIIALGHFTLFTIIVWWGGAGLLTGLVGCLQAGEVPALTSLWDWLRHHRELSARYGTEYVVATGSSQATLLALGAIAGLVALGAIRGAQVYYGPIGVLFGGAYLALGPEGARLRSQPERLRRLMAIASAVLLIVGAMFVAGGVLVPRSIGRSLFGVTWDTTHQVIILAGIAVLGNCIAAGALVGLRALAAARASLRARLYGLPFAVVGPVVGAFWGARGFAVGMVVSSWAGALIWWQQFLRALTEDDLANALPEPPK